MRYHCGLLAIILAFTSSIQAQVTTVTSYKMGESDPGAGISLPAADPTVATVGTPNLTRVGAPVYAAGSPRSALSISFNGNGDRYQNTATAALSATNNFGVEAIVRSNGRTANNATIAYVGNTGSSGFGLFRFGPNYGALYGGVAVITSAASALTPGAWTHIAIVRDNGVSTFYVNGVATTTSTAAPNPAIGTTLIGGNPLVTTESFDGNIDEVRFFTFTVGNFQPARDLNLLPPFTATRLPATSWFGLLSLIIVLSLFGFWRLHHRNAR
jgi:Concanavalin A-like lectin/glucanases superfamily